MTADTASDAERLAEIRAMSKDLGASRAARDVNWFLRLLDARDARIAELEQQRDRLATALAQAEARNVELQRALKAKGESVPLQVWEV